MCFKLKIIEKTFKKVKENKILRFAWQKFISAIGTFSEGDIHFLFELDFKCVQTTPLKENRK